MGAPTDTSTPRRQPPAQQQQQDNTRSHSPREPGLRPHPAPGTPPPDMPDGTPWP
jgi:hypothetical protein